MTFHLSVSGVIPDPGIEQEVIKRLHQIFTDPAITVQSSAFIGPWTSTTVHEPAEAPVPLSTAETEPPAGSDVALEAHTHPEPDPEPPAAAESAKEAPADETNVAA